ncbi:crossover junction endonuclease MUS81 [Aplysia californica]|uniref:Crossover junction endonuclease MUS81 n=1 Tax=Aplysia californica TaxID=6500 RepID=A0ABM1VVC4_APLCA|nr:crossover junction endonuclease MUS81 [Aplysia californica]
MSHSSTDTSSLKGKRKKKLPKNANPLFTQWLTEWRDQAVEKGWKSSHTYSKALKTLRLFPLPLESGKDCRLLQNFGDKICKMLDEKLTEHKLKQADEENMPQPDQDRCSSHNAVPRTVTGKSVCDPIPGTSSTFTRLTDQMPQNTAAASSTALSHGASVHSEPAVDRTRIHDISDSSNAESDTEAVPCPPPSKKRQVSGTRSRDYVPVYRSGPYALLITLFKYMQDLDFKGYLGKTELCGAAQPLCDKSFLMPDPGSRYTAWSSMGTLIKKGLINKCSSPARYSLSDTGYELAERLSLAETVRRASAENCHESSASSSVVDVNSSKACEVSPFDRCTVADQALRPEPSNSLGQSYSTKLTTESAREFSVSSTSANYHEKVSLSTQDERVSGVDVVVLSDDDEADFCGGSSRDEEVLKDWPPVREIHCVSPSPSPPPVCFSPGLDVSLELQPASPIGDHHHEAQTSPGNIVIPYSKAPSHNSEAVSLQAEENVFEISDDDGEADNDRGGKQQCPSTHSQSDSDSDELPDLDIPLSKRLLLKGKVQSQLLLSTQTTATGTATSVSSTSGPTPAASRRNKPPSSVSDSTQVHAPSQTSQRSTSSAHISELEKRQDAVRVDPCVKDNEFSDIQTLSSYAHKYQSTRGPVCDKDIEILDSDGYNKCSSQAQFGVSGSVDRSKGLPSSVCGLEVSSSKIGAAVTVLSPQQLSPQFSLSPGSFDVVLCIDNREFYGSKSNSKTLLPELMKAGIQCDLRLLHVGDLLWVARERTPPGSAGLNGGKGRELVLNYIVERKRMDDLVSSLSDGRMKEQKFRLKQSGLKDLIILIEEHGSIQNFSISEERIRQSIANSQIIDGFKVKRCGGPKDAVIYLTAMTRSLQQHFTNKTLHAVSVDQLKQLPARQSPQNSDHYMLPFDSFNEASVKQKDLAVRELFAKQLVQVPGVSAERARAITNFYPTLSSLLQAYNGCSTEKAKESLLSTIKCGKNDRNLGIAVSRLISLLYTQSGSLS